MVMVRQRRSRVHIRQFTLRANHLIQLYIYIIVEATDSMCRTELGARRAKLMTTATIPWGAVKVRCDFQLWENKLTYVFTGVATAPDVQPLDSFLSSALESADGSHLLMRRKVQEDEQR